MVIHLVSTSRLRSCGLPIRNVRTTLDCLTLLRAGFTWLFMFPWTPVVSYTTISPISWHEVWMYIFCCTCHPRLKRGPPLQRRLVLRSSDFPPRHWRGDHFTNLNYLFFCSIPEQHNTTTGTGDDISTFLNFDNSLRWQMTVTSTTGFPNNTYHTSTFTTLPNSFIGIKIYRLNILK